MRFPLNIRFKIITIASQIFVTDADGKPVFYVKQKLFKFKEDINIYADDSKSQVLFNIKADRVIDFSPILTLYDPSGTAVGTIKREGMASLWKARYSLTFSGKSYVVQELNPWAKMLDSLLGEIPIINLLTGYILHPRYGVMNPEGQQSGELTKQPAFFESSYSLTSDSIATADEATQRQFAALMMVVVLMERSRG